MQYDTLVLAKFLKVTYNNLNWITITKDIAAHNLILSSQHFDPKWSNHNEAKIDGETWLLISFRSESFIFTLGEGKVNIFQSTLWIPQSKKCHVTWQAAKSISFPPWNISKSWNLLVVSESSHSLCIFLQFLPFFSLVSVRYMCFCGWCVGENGLYDPDKWLCLQYKLLHVFVKIVMCTCQSWYIYLLIWEMMKRVVFIILTNDFASNIGLFLAASISLLIRRSGR